ncbi:MAG: transglycosylase SLT domain-containing protein [bacterium]
MISILSFILGLSLINTHIPLAVSQTKNYNHQQTPLKTASVQLDYSYYNNVSKPGIKKQADLLEANRLAQEQILIAEQEARAETLRQQELLSYQTNLQRKNTANQQQVASVVTVSGDFQSAIYTACANFGCDPNKLIRVMYCESGGRSGAYNKSGPYIGLFQFLSSTFNANARRVGIANPNVWDSYQQINVAAYMFSIGQAGRWTCK